MELLIPLAILLGVIIWSVLMQRKAIVRQEQSMETQREAVDRQMRALVQVEESLNLSRKQVENQEKIIALLEQIRDGKTS